MNRLGFTYAQAGHLYFSEWSGLFDAYKQHHNFETKRMLYKLEAQEEEISSLDAI